MGRVCAEPGCPTLAVDSNRCDEHKRKPWAKDTRRRGTSGWDWQRTVARILKRDRYACHWCITAVAVTADHVQAVADGGSDDDSNLVAACSTCNTRRMLELIAARRNGPHTPLRANQNLLGDVGSSRVDLQACKLEYSIVSPK